MCNDGARSFIRYLAAKRTVDDRALNGHVWQQFALEMRKWAEVASRPLRIVELGAGIGTMVERLWEAGLLPDGVEYRAIDSSAENIDHAASRLESWGLRRGLDVERFSVLEGSTPACALRFLRLHENTLVRPPLTIHLVTADAFAHLAETSETPPDVLIAHAFLDLVHLPRAMADIRSAVAPGALLYLTINFDGATILEPAIEPELDKRIEQLYHATMDRRLVKGQPSGDSHTGRRLYHTLLESGCEVMAAGASDWVVGPTTHGYAADEAYFLHFIVDTIAGALKGNPDLDDTAFARWIAQRHQQIDRHELLFIAHQLDYLARAPGPR